MLGLAFLRGSDADFHRNVDGIILQHGIIIHTTTLLAHILQSCNRMILTD